jgi:hypothetical protein
VAGIGGGQGGERLRAEARAIIAEEIPALNWQIHVRKCNRVSAGPKVKSV